MKKQFFFILFNLFLVNNTYAQSQCQHCNDLLVEGKFSYLKKNTYYDKTDEAISAILNAYDAYKLDKSAANATARLKGIFKGSGSYNEEQIERIFQFYCSETYNFSNQMGGSSFETRFIEPELVEMYKECIKACKNNIEFKIDPVDEDFSSVTFSVKYSGDPTNIPKVQSVGFDTKKFKVVNNELLKAAANKEPLTSAKILQLERIDITNTPFRRGNDSLYATSHSITFNFSSETYTVHFPEIKYESKKRLKIQSGYVEKFHTGDPNQDDPNWPLSKTRQNSPRTAMVHVKFDHPFEKAPAVITGISFLDAEESTSLRVRAFPRNISATGFDIEFSTFVDTVIRGIGVHWVAHAE